MKNINKNIIFTNTLDVEIEVPLAASDLLPEWYKNTKSYVDDKKIPNNKNGINITIKKCMPVFDAISSGYLIVSPVDIWVSIKNEKQYFESSNLNIINFHPLQQAEDHPKNNNMNYPKWNNFWSIKTPKGYSSLFIQPMHHDLPFTIFPGIVDTDTYYAPVNIPFTMNDQKFEGLIPKGTPIVQVLPFKRESWKKSFGGDFEKNNIKQISYSIKSKFFDSYKTMFRSKKQYK